MSPAAPRPGAAPSRQIGNGDGVNPSRPVTFWQSERAMRKKVSGALHLDFDRWYRPANEQPRCLT